MPLLKRLFWVYFLLLIFEGALRKWILPQLATPLLLVRDPISVFIIWEAYRTHKWPKQWSAATGILAAGLLGLCIVQLVVTDNPWFAALYGLRSYLLPFPVAFIMGANLDEEDLRKFGNWTLWLLFPITALEVMQYNSSPSSIWNKGAAEGAMQLGYVAEHVRASATFSYVMGPMFYTPLAAAFIFYGMANPKFAKKGLLWAAAAALVLSIPVIGSRTVVYELAALLLCVGIASLFGVSQFKRSLQIIAILLIGFALVSQLPVFSSATSSLVERLAESSNVEGNAEQSLVLRVFHPITKTLSDSIADNNLLGIGMGHGANAVTKLLTGSINFLAGEEAFPRAVLEFGWPCGLAFMLFRFLLAMTIAILALAQVREHRPLAWLLVPMTFHAVALGGIDQPTVQGFMVIGIGFSLAAMRRPPIPADFAVNLSASRLHRRFRLNPR
jgi:hypothetical protein